MKSRNRFLKALSRKVRRLDRFKQALLNKSKRKVALQDRQNFEIGQVLVFAMQKRKIRLMKRVRKTNNRSNQKRRIRISRRRA